jgi:hypothetical protein
MSWFLSIFDATFTNIHVFEYTPFFWVWTLSIFVWFFLELAVWAAQYFNSKHTYTAATSRTTILFLSVLKLVNNDKKSNYLKVAYGALV